MSSEEYLLSGFGPFGRNRLFYEQTGRSIVSASKDITQLLGSDAYDMFSFGKQSNELNIFLQNSCKEYTQRVGDGLKSTLLLLHSFLEGLRFDRNSNCSYSNQHALSLGHIPAQIQVQILDIIYSVIKSHRHLIESDFRRQKVWFLANDARDWFSSIVKSVLIPAMTASSTQASRLERILTKWIFPSENTSTKTFAALERSIAYHLQHWSSSIFVRADATLVTAAMEVLPSNKVVIAGRCRQLAMLSDGERHGKFICIQTITPLYQQHVYHLRFHHPKDTDAHLSCFENSAQSLEFIKQMQESRIGFIMCHEKVDDQLSTLLIGNNIALIDDIPLPQLEYLNQKTSNDLYTDINDFCTSSESLHSNSFLSNVNVYYRTENNAISGTEFTLEIDPMKPAEDLTQLILTFPSSLAAKNTLFNLKRCLRTVLYSFPPKSSDQEVRKVLCVPGGGAAEMSWAQLWESVDVELKAMQYDVSSGQPNALIVSIAKSLNTLLSRRHPVASIYCHRILFHLSTAYYALPQRLLKNCLDIFEPAEMTSHLQEMSPHTFISEDVSIIVDHILRSRCNKFQKAWSIWKALNSRDDVSGLPQRHFFGILANSDPTSTIPCFLGPGEGHGVYESSEQFLSRFDFIIELSRTFLRITGHGSDANDGVIHIQKTRLSDYRQRSNDLNNALFENEDT